MDNITKYISEITYTYSSANVIGNRDGMWYRNCRN